MNKNVWLTTEFPSFPSSLFCFFGDLLILFSDLTDVELHEDKKLCNIVKFK